MKAIVFDVDDTLYDRSEPFRRAYAEMFGNLTENLVRELYWASCKRGDEVFEAAQTGRMPMEASQIYRFQKGFSDVGIQITDRQALDFQQIYAARQQEIVVPEGMKRVLDFCRLKKAPMGIITNGSTRHQWNKIHRLEMEKWIPEEWIVVSGECNIRKPDEKIFKYMEERMGLINGEYYYIGDSYANDMVGAVKAGWKTVWLNRQGLSVPDGEIQPDYRVKNEEELLSCVHDLFE